MTDRSATSTILPGAWLGVFGGGQLGRMFTHAAQALGYRVAILEPEEESPAGQAADRHFCETTSKQSAEELVDEMSQLCSVITLEFENISAQLVQRASKRTLTRPGASFLEVCQNRIAEKSQLSRAGFPTTPFLPANSEADVLVAAEQLGWPLVLKTARSGYDGKGQAIVRTADEVTAVWANLETSEVIAEQWIDFLAEVSMIAARNASGNIECYPLLENDHAHHILDVTRCPASEALQKFESQASEICHGIATEFDVVGLFCVEFFVTNGGQLMINEIAPRPHNSGHLTIEAFTCSQFEQQVRAICNLPLIPADQLRPAAMANLLGDLWFTPLGRAEPNWEAVLQSPDAHLHLYGKSEPRPARKMGHLTSLHDDAACQVRQLRSRLSH
ncbi:MAG: 5-(carboxyamino)imidazole ribonucleotide synthase [Pirellulaceae bacterium]